MGEGGRTIQKLLILFAMLIVRFYQVLLSIELLYFYCVKNRIHTTYLDGKKKIDFLILKPLRWVVGWTDTEG